jgi:glycosyltransferase involved in cell wall biosynthesis
MKRELAIVIPAYKSLYFRETLRSISIQDQKDFTLYIGDDASPDDLLSIVNEFQSCIPIIYKRFESNLGGTDLVGHWERCIDMVVNGEKWIWLQSVKDKLKSEFISF